MWNKFLEWLQETTFLAFYILGLITELPSAIFYTIAEMFNPYNNEEENEEV